MRLAKTRATQTETLYGYCLSLSFHSLPSPLPRSWLPATPPQKWHMCLADIVQDRIPPFDHRSFQPGLYAHRLLCDALDHYLIVANEDWHGPETFVPTFTQKCQR